MTYDETPNWDRHFSLNKVTIKYTQQMTTQQNYQNKINVVQDWLWKNHGNKSEWIVNDTKYLSVTKKL